MSSSGVVFDAGLSEVAEGLTVALTWAMARLKGVGKKSTCRTDSIDALACFVVMKMRGSRKMYLTMGDETNS